MYCSFFIESGTLVIVERGVYHSTLIVLKKLHVGTSSDIRKIFAKKVGILAKVAPKNILSVSVYNKPVSIMMKLCDFSFIPFGGTELVNSLDKILILMSEESYLFRFPGPIPGTLLPGIKLMQLLICIERTLHTVI